MSSIASDTIRFRASANVESAGPRDDVVIRHTVTNTGPEPIALTAFTLAPGQARIERVISRLLPGQTTIKSFRYPMAANELSGKVARVGLREIDGPALLNQVVDIP